MDHNHIKLLNFYHKTNSRAKRSTAQKHKGQIQARCLYSNNSACKFFHTTLIFLCCFILYGCSSPEHESPDLKTGTLAFSLSVKPLPKVRAIESKAINCSKLGIEDIIATVYNNEDDVVATGGPWPCSSRTGSLSKVPEGSQYRLLIQARDENRIVQYRGLVSGVSVTAGDNTNIGEVSLVPILGLEDTDADGVPDDVDQCPDTPETNPVDMVGCPIDKTMTNSAGMTFVYIEPGPFTMGSSEFEPDRYGDETQHEVTLTKGYYMQSTEITQGQWEVVMGSESPSYFSDCGNDCPVENVSWQAAQRFITALNDFENTVAYRLPTEAEWEYAARAGTTTPFYFGECISTNQANFVGNKPLSGCASGYNRQATTKAASFSPNNWGLYDMHGNVSEWCLDWYADYSPGNVKDPSGPSSGSNRVLRGGAWYDGARESRSANRIQYPPITENTGVGFRLVYQIQDQDKDGVEDAFDECSDTQEHDNPDGRGCGDNQRDTDDDGVVDAFDECPDTPENDNPDSKGCGDSQHTDPVADAGDPVTVHVGNSVTLGSGISDADGDTLTYNWEILSPADSSASLVGETTIHPVFTPDEPGNYVIRLTVSDGLTSSSDTVTVTSTNTPPVSDAGEPVIVHGLETVTFSGLGSSDADGDTLTYDWKITERPSGSRALLSHTPGQSSTTLTPDVSGIYVISLTVNDDFANSESSLVTLTVFISTVPDSGQRTCYDEQGASILCPSEGEDYYGQDATYMISQPSYTKLDSDGKALPDSAESWAMVKDNVTGLIWEVKTNDGEIHDSDTPYTWYDARDKFIDRLNTNDFGGFDDWRLPTFKELAGIVDYGKTYNPVVNTDYFVYTRPSSNYWTATTFASDTHYAWRINLGNSNGNPDPKDSPYFVRAVRGNLFSENFKDNGDGTVTDNDTHLMWMQETSGINMPWKDALSYCENLTLAGHSDWRLPTIKELRSIVDYSAYNSDNPIAINTTFFPITKSSYYWTSTTYAYNTEYAWRVNFNGFNGYDGGYFKHTACYVRAVRGGQ